MVVVTNEEVQLSKNRRLLSHGRLMSHDDPTTMSGAGVSSILTILLLSSTLVGIILMMFVRKDKQAELTWTVTRILYYVALLALLSVLTLSGVGDGGICIGEPFFDCRNVIVPFSFLLLAYIVATCWCTPVPGENRKPGRAPLEDESTESVAAFDHQDQNTIPAAMDAVAPSNDANIRRRQEPREVSPEGLPNFKDQARTFANSDPHENMPIANAMPVRSATPQQVTKTIENTPQGRKITVVVVHPDGTKTTKTTFETVESAEIGQSQSGDSGGYNDDDLEAQWTPFASSPHSFRGRDPSGI